MSQKTSNTSSGGFTFASLLVAIVVAAIVLVGLTRLFSTAINDFTSQKSVGDMRMAAKNSTDAMAAIIRQAGFGLPDSDAAVQVSPQRDTLTLHVNERGAYQAISNSLAGRTIPVGDALPFFRARKITRLRATSPAQFDTLSVDTTRNTGNFVNGIDTVGDSIYLTASATLLPGEVIYTPKLCRYYVDNATKELRVSIDGSTNLLSQNIDTVRFRFFDFAGAGVTGWESMQKCSLQVTARSSRVGRSGTASPDGYGRFTLKRQIVLRNHL